MKMIFTKAGKKTPRPMGKTKFVGTMAGKAPRKMGR